MSNRIRGLTIEIDGNTTKLQTALKGVETKTKSMKAGLRDVDRLLKFNPTSTELLTQKQAMFRTALDQSRQKLTTLKTSLEQMRAQDGFDEQSEDAQRLKREIFATEQEVKRFERAVARTASVAGMKMEAIGTKVQAVGTKMSALGSSMTRRVSMPIALAGAAGVKKFAEVDKTMQLTKSTMGATAKEAEELNQAMKDAASNSTFAMKDAAQASLNFARAGLDAQQAADALAPAMNLAAGEGGNLETVSAGLVATINGFGDSFDQSARYADTFANACNNSALDVDSLSSSMSIAAPVFASAGYSVEDAALYMGVMANNGIDAGKAANSLKTGISRLVKPTDEAATWMDKLGISITDADGNMKDTVSLQKELNGAFKGLSKSERIAAASAIFGKNQMAPWLALINAAPSDVDSLSKSLKKEGTTAKMAQDMMSGFGGSLEKLKSSLDVALTSFGEALAPSLSELADGIQAAVDKFNALDQSTRESIAKAALFAVAAGPALVVIGKLTSGVGSLIKIAGMATSQFAALGPAVGGIGGPIYLAAAGTIGFTAGMVALTKAFRDNRAEQAGLTDAQKKTLGSLSEASKAYEDLETARDQATEKISGEFDTTEGLVEKYNALIGKNGEVKKGYEDRAEYIKGMLAEALGVESSKIDDLIGKNGKLKDSVYELIDAKKAEALLDVNKDTYTKALETQATSTKKLSDAQLTLHRRENALGVAQQNVAKAQDDLARARQSGARNTTQYAQKLEAAKDAERGAREAVDKTRENIDKYKDTLERAGIEIENYEGLQKAVHEGNQKKIKQYTDALLNHTKVEERTAKRGATAVTKAERQKTSAVGSEGRKRAAKGLASGKALDRAEAKGISNGSGVVVSASKAVIDRAISAAQEAAKKAKSAGSTFGDSFKSGLEMVRDGMIAYAQSIARDTAAAASSGGGGKKKGGKKKTKPSGLSASSVSLLEYADAIATTETGRQQSIIIQPLSRRPAQPQTIDNSSVVNNFTIHVDGSSSASDVADEVIRKVRLYARTA